ncbi:MAG: VCBS repeat-containing protein [Bacteroidota bacterium]
MLLIVSFFSCEKKKTASLFESLESSGTGIEFVNKLEPISGKLSIVDYLYYYNGAGVAAGDINNDGLTDLFFVSNAGSNKMYLNKGDFKFEDITDKAGLKSFAEWKTGVTMSDVNGDGFLDIYVCAVANYMNLEGVNELYINNGNNTFSEKAAEYGLAFSGFSTQSAFFDYDHDGDLDMYLLNHATHTSRSYDKVIARTLRDKDAGDYLYRNDNGKFVDVSEAAGIYQAAMGYGLGITIADLNNDGWEDIYATKRLSRRRLLLHQQSRRYI